MPAYPVVVFNEYQMEAGKTAIYPGKETINGLYYTTLGLAGEAGEIANKVKKLMRRNAKGVTEEEQKQLADELGDVLWYVAMVATELNVPFHDIANNNLRKLYSRQARGTLEGHGDNR